MLLAYNCLQRALAFSVLFGLAGCGMRVPDVEISSDPDAHGILINKVVNLVKCEIGRAVVSALRYDQENVRQFPGRARSIKWLDNWGAWLTIKFTVVEKGAFSPGLTTKDPLPNSQTFTLGLGGVFSSEATRVEQVQYLVIFRDYIPPSGRFVADPPPCQQLHGSIMLQSDLKVKDWLDAALYPYFITDNIRPVPPKVLSYDISFAAVASGSVTPTWTLVRLTAAGNPLASSSRTRTDALTITMGEVDAKLRTPSRALLDANLASQIRSAFTESLQAPR
jgi:hypothetical protein